uniref:DUF2797 domain-containing protein n=1 Tax=Thaumasiovibrio occultus TaxID=1891184 RepID=UPI000B354A59|nr:DUF2797 domain-containing protein [Thaumasiovibrio occultus]
MLGTIKKLTAVVNTPLDYQLPIGDNNVNLSDKIGQTIAFQHTGNIFCANCGKRTKKSYSQGFCFVCMKKLAACDMCILKPETCHFDQGTCREPEWAQSHCMVPHIVYLSNTSGVKVGITRKTQIPTRWIDQGAIQALPIFETKTRKISGLVEIALAQHIADKTNWRALLKGEAEQLDLASIAAELKAKVQDELAAICNEYGSDAVQEIIQDDVPLGYPVTQYPAKITSFNLDKNPRVEGTLMGIKGQYLILDNGVINIRKYTSYEIEWLSDV